MNSELLVTSTEPLLKTDLNLSWYVIHTKARWEKKVARQCESLGIPTYCPLNKVKRQWSDRKKIVEEPLFSSYVFVQLSNIRVFPFRKIAGANNFIYWLSKPAIVRDEEIDVIKKFLESYENVFLEKSEVKVHDHVKVLGGPLMEREGKVLEVKHKSIRILLPSLGFHLVAEIEKSNAEIISINKGNSESALYSKA